MRRRKPISSQRGTSLGQAFLLKRLLSFLIDLFIINLIIVGPFQSLLMRLLPGEEGILSSYQHVIENEGKLSFVYAVTFFITLFALLYFILLEYGLGQTIGKIIMNLRVTGEHGEAGLLQCTGRSLFIIPVFPFSLLWVLDPLYLVLLSSHGQRFSEYISQTYVKASR